MQVRNLQYNSVGTIDMEIEHPRYGWIPFTASPDDSEQHGRDLYQKAVDGELGEIADYVPPEPPSIEELREVARLSREDFLLAIEDAGLYDLAESAVYADETLRRIRIRWENAQNFRRMDVDLVEMAHLSGITDEQMDGVFGIGAD